MYTNLIKTTEETHEKEAIKVGVLKKIIKILEQTIANTEYNSRKQDPQQKTQMFHSFSWLKDPP